MNWNPRAVEEALRRCVIPGKSAEDLLLGLLTDDDEVLTHQSILRCIEEQELLDEVGAIDKRELILCDMEAQ